MKRVIAIAFAVAALLLAACGQKGALVRPDHSDATVVSPPATPAKTTP